MHLRIGDSFAATFGVWFSISSEAALAAALEPTSLEAISFPNRRRAVILRYQAPRGEQLGRLIIIDSSGDDAELVALLPLPTRILSGSDSPSDLLGRLCNRFGDRFEFAGESTSLLLRISAETSLESLGDLPKSPFVYEDRVYAPIVLTDFFPPGRWECLLTCVIRITDLQAAVSDPDPWKSAPVANLELINGIFSLLSDNVTCVSNWGLYLFDPMFKGELELKNKVTAIWLTGLLDSVEAEERTADEYERNATAQGLHHLLSTLAQARLFLRFVKDILALYTREEQLFIRDFRDQLVHSWLGRRHTQSFHVKYFEAGGFRHAKMSRTDFATIIRPFYEAGNFEVTLARLFQRALDPSLPYWKAVYELRANLANIQDAMTLGRVIELSTLRSQGS